MRGKLRCVEYCVAALLSGCLAACGPNPSKHTENDVNAMQSDPSKGIICTTEIPTGSFMKTKKCTTPEERERQRREAEHQMVIEPRR